jgi:hypothetical protein
MRGTLFVMLAFFAALLTSARTEDSYWLKTDFSVDSGSHYLHPITITYFESLADETDYINRGSFLYNRGLRGPVDSFSRCFERLGELSRFATVELLELAIAHKNARVRTLGLYAILAKEDPKLLPLVFSAIRDSERTFPQQIRWDSPSPLSMENFSMETLRSGQPNERLVRVKNTTVAEHATAILHFYAEIPYGFDQEGNLNSRFIEQWNAYWEARQDRDYCAGWIRAGFKRATGGTSPLPGERIRMVEKVKYQGIWRLPSPDRQLTLLWLAARWRAHPDDHVLQEHLSLRILASNDDLRVACQQLGPDRLMQVLRFESITNDPDLQPSDRHYRQIARWVLINAQNVFPSKMAPELVELGLSQGNHGDSGFVSPWWFIAAAQLQPERAGQHLDQAWSLFDRKYREEERAWLMWARWKVLGLAEYDTIADWFYSDKEQPGSIGGGYHRFLRMLSGPDAPKFLAKLALEDGFLELNACDLGFFALAVSRFAFNPPVDPQDYPDLGRSGHPTTKEAKDAVRSWAKAVQSSGDSQQVSGANGIGGSADAPPSKP